MKVPTFLILTSGLVFPFVFGPYQSSVLACANVTTKTAFTASSYTAGSYGPSGGEATLTGTTNVAVFECDAPGDVLMTVNLDSVTKPISPTGLVGTHSVSGEIIGASSTTFGPTTADATGQPYQSSSLTVDGNNQISVKLTSSWSSIGEELAQGTYGATFRVTVTPN